MTATIAAPRTTHNTATSKVKRSRAQELSRRAAIYVRISLDSTGEGVGVQYVVTQRVGSSVELIPHLFGANRRPTGQRGAWLWARYGADSINDAAFRMLVA